MRRLIAAFAIAAALVAPAPLLGCDARPDEQGAASASELVFEETMAPNEAFAASEDDVVYDTVRVTQDDSGIARVEAASNSAFFDPVTYEIDCGGSLTAEDVSVEWTTLMGSPEGTREDQLAVAVVSVRTADGETDVRKINFVNGGLEIVAEAASGA